MVAVRNQGASLVEPGSDALQVTGLGVSSDYFRALRGKPYLGRVPNAEEFAAPDVPNIGDVIVLSHRFWMSHFGGDPEAVGRKILFGGKSAEIIGVMPPEFEAARVWSQNDFWRPLRFPPGQERARGNNGLNAFGRLKPGVTLKQAQHSMSALADAFISENLMPQGEGLRLEPLQRSTSNEVVRNALWFMFALTCFVLLIACGNLANLQLVHTASRVREYAIRTALGAKRFRLLRQTLTESLIISLIGGGLSLILANWLIKFISHRFPMDPPLSVQFDYSMFYFALLASIITGLIFGAVPAWLSSRINVNKSLTEGSKGSISARSHNRLRNVLIVGQVAFALMLLTGAGLLWRGLERFMLTDPGWRIDGLVVAQVRTPGGQAQNEAQQRVFVNQLEQRLSALPGVSHASLSWSLPLYGYSTSGGVVAEGQPAPDPSYIPELHREAVSLDYFNTLGIRLLEGRTFNSADKADSPAVTIINRTMARQFWPDESAVGNRISYPGNPNWVEIVGVVNDIDYPANLDEPYTRLQSFLPITQVPWNFGSWWISMRGSITAEAIGRDLKKAVGEIDKNLPVYQIQTARSMVDEALQAGSMAGILLIIFAGIGIVLAAIGIYGVISYSVAQQTGEIGIRMALGAQRKDVIRLILRKGIQLGLIGTLLGLIGGYIIANLLNSLIPRLPAYEPLAIVVFAAVLFGISLGACYVPAYGATRIDPTDALRSE
jgi:predicted permease